MVYTPEDQSVSSIFEYILSKPRVLYGQESDIYRAETVRRTLAMISPRAVQSSLCDRDLSQHSVSASTKKTIFCESEQLPGDPLQCLLPGSTEIR